MPPLAYHEATGPDDEVVVFLNAALFLPHPTLEGTAPVTIYGKCLLDPSDGPDLAQIGRDVASKGDSTLDGVAAGETDDDADDHDVRMLFAMLSDQDIVREAEQSLEGEDVGSQQPGARRLREYWVHGKGAAKVRWGVPNDVYRCVELLSKYVGTRSRGLCNVYRRSALGVAPGMEHGEEPRFEWAAGTAPLALKDFVLEDRPEAEEDMEFTLPVKTCKASGEFGSAAEEIDDELPARVAGDLMEDGDSFKSMFGIVDDLGKDVFDSDSLLQLKRLATVYDFALELDFPDAVVTAESKVATFLSDAIDQAEDEDKADTIRDIAAAMVELREEEDQAVAERERLYAEAEARDGAGDQN